MLEKNECKDIGGEVYLTGTGVIILAYVSWKVDNMPVGREEMQRYCQYLAMHGYGEGATAIMTTLEGMSVEDGTKWIRASYNRYVDDMAAAVNYVLGV